MNIHVTGHKGKLGYVLVHWFGCTPMEVDVTKREEIESWLAKYQPDVVINCAAKSNVDFSETNYPEANVVNFGGVSNFIRAAHNVNCFPKFIQLSTDYVFPGNGGPYNDLESVKVTKGMGGYGLSKISAELALGVTYHNHVICRVTGLFGSYNGTHDLITNVLDAIANDQPIRLTNQLRGNPTYIPYLASKLYSIALDREFTGQTIHIAPAQVMSRYEFVTQFVLPVFGMSQYSDLMIPCSTDVLGWKAQRPTKGGLIPSYGFEITETLEAALTEYGEYLGVLV